MGKRGVDNEGQPSKRERKPGSGFLESRPTKGEQRTPAFGGMGADQPAVGVLVFSHIRVGISRIPPHRARRLASPKKEEVGSGR